MDLASTNLAATLIIGGVVGWLASSVIPLWAGVGTATASVQ